MQLTRWLRKQTPHHFLRRWRTKRKLYLRRRVKPAIYGIPMSQYSSLFSGWMARLNGAGLIATVALMIQSYGALSINCPTRRFFSYSLKESAILFVTFLMGGILAVLAANAPRLVGYYRNNRYESLYLNRPSPVNVGNELEGLSAKKVRSLSDIQFILTILSLSFFGIASFSPVHFALTQTPKTMSKLWSTYEQACLSESASS